MAGAIRANAGTAEKDEGHAGKRETLILLNPFFVNKPLLSCTTI